MRGLGYFVVMGFALIAFGQINTDRPTQSFSPHVMPQSGFQIEAGFVSERPVNGVDLYSVSYGALGRYGITDWVEFRLSTQYGAVRINKSEEGEMDNPTFGFKFNFLDETEGPISMGLLTTFYGTDEDGDKGIDQTNIVALFQTGLSDNVTLAWNVGTVLTHGGAESANGYYTVMIGIGLMDELSVFFEPYGFFAKNTPTDHRFNTGLTYLVSNNFQLDASIGNGLTSRAPDYFLSIGASVLF